MDSKQDGAASPPYQPQTAQFQARYLAKRQHEDINSIAGCVSTGSSSFTRRKKKDLGLWGTLRTWIVQHQIGISINLLLLLALAHICFPRARRRTRKFFELQYYDAASGEYLRGPDDIYYVLFWIVIFTGLRDAVMRYVLHPFAEIAGIHKPKMKTRFTEQAWLFLYDGIFWTLGMYIYITSPYFFSLPNLWADFPIHLLTPLFKRYYLVQFAFWLQQIVVVNIEERRKDHWQMFTHHIVTCMLMILSYGYYQTRVGNVILCIMDVGDIVLPAAKMLKYAGYQTACDVAFGVFILSWFLARHVAYILVCWSVYHDSGEVMTFGCYNSINGAYVSETPPPNSRFLIEPDSNGRIPPGGTEMLTNVLQPYIAPGETVCYNVKMKWVFLSLLCFLQGILMLWFTMIIRVAYRVLKGQGADDSRSDDEDEDDAESDADVDTEKSQHLLDAEPPKPVEQVVGVEELNIKRKSSPSTRFSAVRKEQGSSSGIGVKKEILNRIGCEVKSSD